MQSTTQKPSTTPQPKVSHKASITGIVLAILSLISSGIASLMVNAKYTPTGPTTGSIETEAGHAVATGATSTLGALFGLPFIVGGVVLALISVIFIALRLRKVRVGGFVFSAIAVVLVVWSVSIALGALDHISAKPVG